MQKLTKTQKALLSTLLNFVYMSALGADSTTRMREWNGMVQLYGERIIPTLKDVAHHTGECRVLRAQAKIAGVEMDQALYEKHLIIAKSFAHQGAEDW